MDAAVGHLLIWVSATPHMAPAVSAYSISAGVVLPQMPVVVNLQEINTAETQSPAQAREEIPITKAENSIVTKMESMIQAFKAWDFLLRTANDTRFGCYQTARADAIRADPSPLHKGINFTALTEPRGPAYYLPGHNYQQYPHK
jgi:hypothetical protein